MHLDQDTLEKLLNTELHGDERAAAEAHLDSCAPCRELLVKTEREVGELDGMLALLDDPAPEVDPGDLIVRASRRQAPAWARWAAGTLLMFGAAGAAYAAPGSPLPTWIERLLGPDVGRDTEAQTATSPDTDGVLGIVVPVGADLEIVFTRIQATGVAQISLADVEDLRVEVVGGTASFDSNVERLMIDSEGSSPDYSITIPRAVSRVAIRVAETIVFVREGGQVATNAELQDDGGYLLFLALEPR